MKKTREFAADIVFGALLLCTVFLYLSRIDLGMADMDESFYLTIPFRLTQGDALLVDEWHVSQLAGFLIYPWMKLYLAVTGGSTEGIVLHFRYIYLFVQMVVTIGGYLCLRKRGKWMAVIVSLVYALFTPFGIKALSYNTMGLMATYLFVILGLTPIRRLWLKYMVMGCLLATAVLCNPYMIVLYALLAGATLLVWLLYKVWATLKWSEKESGFFGGITDGLKRTAELFSWKNLLWLTVGAGILFVLFMGFELSRVSLSQMLDSFQFVAGDSAHKSKTLSGIFNSFRYYVREYPYYFRCWAICVVIGLVIRRSSPVNFAVISGVSVWLTLHFALKLTNGIGYSAIMVPLSFTGLAAFLFTRKRRWKLLGGWMIGFLYCLCMSASSNNGIYTFANASTVGACIGLLMIYDYLKEVFSFKKARKGGEKKANVLGAMLSGLAAAALIVLVGTQVFAESYVLSRHIFWESNPESLTTKVEEGPLAGLHTVSYKVKRYQINYENVMSLRELDGDHVLFYCRAPWGYLALCDWQNGANSAWLADSIEDLNDVRMDEYDERHPEKIPDVIYIDTESEDVWSDDEWASYCEENGYRLEEFENGGFAMIRE